MKVKAFGIGGSVAMIFPSDIAVLLGVVDGTDMEMDLEHDLLGKVLTIRKVKV